MREPSFLRRAVLVGALALSLTGVTAGIVGAQAMPVDGALAPAPAAGALTTVQYMGYRHHRRHRHAGVYDCGPGALHTHLERRACGSNGVGHNGRYR